MPTLTKPQVLRYALTEALASTQREIEEWKQEQDETNYELTTTEDFEYAANLEGTASGYEHAIALVDEILAPSQD